MNIDSRHKKRSEEIQAIRTIAQVMEERPNLMEAVCREMRPAKSEILIKLEDRYCENPLHESFGFPIDECVEYIHVLETVHEEL